MAADHHAMHHILTLIDAFTRSNIEAHSTRPKQLFFWHSLTTGPNRLRDLRSRSKSEFYDHGTLRHAVTYSLRSWKKERYVKRVEGVQAVNTMFKVGSAMFKKEYLDKIGFMKGQIRNAGIDDSGPERHHSSSPHDSGFDINVQSITSSSKGKRKRDAATIEGLDSPKSNKKAKRHSSQRPRDGTSSDSHDEAEARRPKVTTLPSNRTQCRTFYANLSGIGDLPDEEVQSSFDKINALVKTATFTIFPPFEDDYQQRISFNPISEPLKSVYKTMFDEPCVPESTEDTIHPTIILRSIIWAFLQTSILEKDIPDDSPLRGVQSHSVVSAFRTDTSLIRAQLALNKGRHFNVQSIFRDLALHQLRDPHFISTAVHPAAQEFTSQLSEIVFAHTSLLSIAAVPIASLLENICIETLTLAARIAVSEELWTFVRRMPGEKRYYINEDGKAEGGEVELTVVPGVRWGRAVVVEEWVEFKKGTGLLQALTPEVEEEEDGDGGFKKETEMVVRAGSLEGP